MIKRLFAVILAVAAFSGIFSGRTAAASPLPQEIADGIISHESGGDTEKWLSFLSENAGEGAEWYIIALSQYRPEYDLSEYADALERYLSENEVRSAASRQRCALALIACGRRDSDFVSKTANDSIGGQGLMSLIFGLHLLNNGVTSEKYTIKSLAEEILSSRLSDGGWAVMGGNSDVDVTAMAVQALAPLYGKDSGVKAAVDSALALLSEKQLDDGGFSGYGAENPESAAQVIVALSSLGKDITKEVAFIRNGRTVPEAMADFRLHDGSFAHKSGGESSVPATQQAFYSSVSLLLLGAGKSLYIFEDRPAEDNTKESLPDTSLDSDTQSNTQTVPVTGNVPAQSGKRLNIILSVICISAGTIVCVIMLLKGSRRPKDHITVIAAALILAVLCFFADIKTPEEYYSDSGIGKPAGYVTLSVSCKTVSGRGSPESLPKDGVIIAEALVPYPDDGTVYDALVFAAKKNRIPIVSKGGGTAALYVSAIGSLSEFDFGPKSGWVYLVDGEMPSVSCAEYRLRSGETVEWHYTCTLGEDIGK